MGRPALGFAAALLLFFSASAHAESERSYSIEAFQARIVVESDSSLLVQETIALAFWGSHQGIFRTIPLRHRPGAHRLHIDQVQVLDGQGAPLRTEISASDDRLAIRVWMPGAQNATRTVALLYRVRGALHRFPDHDELYWNVTGTDSAATIRLAEATVELPKTVPADSVTSIAFSGPAGARGRDYETEQRAGSIVFRTTRPLDGREGLTVAVGWAPGHVRFPSRAQELGWFVLEHRWFALPVLVFLGCLLIWQQFGRDPAGSAKPEYEPPRDLRPGEMGTLVDETVDSRDIIATVVDLAVRGYVHIERTSSFLHAYDYLITLTKPWLGDPEVRPFEVVLLAQIFGDGNVGHMRRLSDFKQKSGETVRPIRNTLYKDLVERRYFLASPYAVRHLWRVAGGAVALTFAALYQTDFIATTPLIAGLISGAIITLFAKIMPRKTSDGARAKYEVLGFKEFLARAEKDQLKRLPPDTLHKWLPYAIALGVEAAWLRGFEGLPVDSPTWYTSPTPFTLGNYSGDVRVFSQAAEHTWVSGSNLFGEAGESSDTSAFPSSSSEGGSSGGGEGGGGVGTF